MKDVDFSAEILPGLSAGGFSLGTKLTNILERLPKFEVWDSKTRSIEEAIKAESYLLARFSGAPSEHESGCSLFLERGTVELNFGHEGVLYEIVVSQGYVGKLLNRIAVGVRLDIAQDLWTLDYDDGDDLHYPSGENAPRGVAFYSDSCSLEESPAQLIRSISVHDWSLR
jgi:hypothetical protein